MSNTYLADISDARFSFIRDNPFKGNYRKQQLASLKKYISNHINDFKEVDWITDSRCYNVPFNKPVFNHKILQQLDDNKLLNFHVCTVILNISKKINNSLHPDLIEYCQDSIANGNVEEETVETQNVDNPTEIINSDQVNNVTSNFEERTYNENDSSLFSALTSNEQNIYKDNRDETTYNLTPSKALSYKELCYLCENIARTKLITNIAKDENIIYAENREKQRLKTELKKYMKNNEIFSKLNVKIDELSVSQLNQALDQAKEIYETIKVTDLVSKGINLLELGCNYVFPNGIKIPKKNKVIKLNGIGQSINTLLFDRNSPLNIAYNNIIEKYNFKVSDGLLCTLSIVQVLASKLTIEDINENETDNKDKKESVEEKSETEEENDSDEDEDEETEENNSDEEESNDD